MIPTHSAAVAPATGEVHSFLPAKQVRVLFALPRDKGLQKNQSLLTTMFMHACCPLFWRSSNTCINQCTVSCTAQVQPSKSH